VVEVAWGIDALYLSGRCDPPEVLGSKLSELQAVAESHRMPQPFEIDGETFMVQGYGWRQYTHLLTHPFGRIGVTLSPQSPAFRIQPLTVALHGLGPEGAVAWFDRVLRAMVPDVDVVVSRLDLYCDLQGWVPTLDVRDQMVCRSRSVVIWLVEGDLGSVTFGRRKGGGLLLRLYDKTRQVFDEGVDYWYPIWGERFDPTRPVWRVEVECGRKALRQFGIDSPADVFDRVGGLWASTTTKSFRLGVPSADQTHCRWRTAPEWEAVQSASLRSDAVPLERLQEAKRAGSLRMLQAPITGVLSSFASLLDECQSIDDMLDELPDYLEEYERWTSRPFMDRVEEKRRR
jgi:hypothetical protein